MACISPCPTGSIDNWRTMPKARPTRSKSSSPGTNCRPSSAPEQLAAEGVRPEDAALAAAEPVLAVQPQAAAGEAPFNSRRVRRRPCRRGRPRTRTPTCSGRRARPRRRSSATSTAPRPASHNQTHHIVLDFGAMPFPVLEGQSIGIVPPGADANGRPHVARQYSVASPRNGERPGYNNVSLTVKRVTETTRAGRCAACARTTCATCKVGDTVQVIGPFGADLPDAEPSEVASRDDLHRHRQRADAGDDRVAPAPAQERQVRRRQADALLRRAHAARSCRTSGR